MSCAPIFASGCRAGLVGFPFFHVEGVRHDASAGLEIENLRTELDVDARQQKQRNHGGLGKVAFEEIRLGEGSFVADAFIARRSVWTTPPCPGCIRCRVP